MSAPTVVPLLTVDDVARRLGVPRKSIYVWRSTGAPAPRAIRVGKHLRFTEEALAEFIASQTEPAA